MFTVPLDKMSVAEKLEAMEALWADLSRRPADVPIPQWHRDVLAARQNSPAGLLDWEQVKASLQQSVTVRLHELTGPALIVPASTSVVYRNQTGGHACLDMGLEGYLVPLGQEEQTREACRLLSAHFTGPKWSGWCGDHIDADTAAVMDRILASVMHREEIIVDRAKLSESWEAWVNVSIERPLPGLIDHDAPKRAILTWPNSD